MPAPLVPPMRAWGPCSTRSISSGPSGPTPIGARNPYGLGADQVALIDSGVGGSAPNSDSSGTTRGIAVVALAEVASRSGASDIATLSISRAFAGSGSNSSPGASGSVNHTDDTAPPDAGTHRKVALACRGTRASESTAATTEMPAAGHSSSSCEASAGSRSADSSRTTRIHGQRWSPWSSAVRIRATDTNWRSRAAAASASSVMWSPAMGDVAERVWGSHFTHVPRPWS